MEAGKQSSSSFTSDLFGAKDSSSSSKILSSIFPPPPKVSGRESIGMSENEKKTAQTAALGDNWVSKDKSRCYFEEEETPPFHYSSSIYYGGQDVYPTQPKTKTFIKEVGKDDSDSGSASRGNWWQGSLYY